jgi:hypothetical protein
MPAETLTYPKLKREFLKQAVSYTLFKGHGAFLLFLWALGAGSMLVLFKMPVLALILTGALLGFAALLARTYLKDRETRAQIVRSIIEQEIRLDELAEGTLKAAVEKGIGLLTEIVGKVLAITDIHGRNDDLHRILGDAYGMLSLQFESAKRIEEYTRVLALINPGGGPSRARGLAKARPSPQGASLREENLATIQRSTAEEQALVGEIGERLETVMLQVLQMERETSDLIKTAEFAEEASETLRSFQAVVNTRRETANVIRRMAPTSM